MEQQCVQLQCSSWLPGQRAAWPTAATWPSWGLAQCSQGCAGVQVGAAPVPGCQSAPSFGRCTRSLGFQPHLHAGQAGQDGQAAPQLLALVTTLAKDCPRR